MQTAKRERTGERLRTRTRTGQPGQISPGTADGPARKDKKETLREEEARGAFMALRHRNINSRGLVM